MQSDCMEKSRQIQVFDTTLRDGQQCPGAGMSFEKNIEYARLACDLRIDVLEAGFPSASNLDFEIVNTIAKEVGHKTDSSIIAGLCQLREDQIDRTIEALSPAIPFHKALVHVYLPVDPELMSASLGDKAKDKSRLVQDLFQCVKKANDAGMQVQFSPEGYSRMGKNFDFVTELIRAAVSAGASVINCPDTIGGGCSFQGQEYFVAKMNKHAEIIAKEFPNRQVIWSVHCHNDFGLAVQNTVNAVFDGPARQIEGCINGIGERAGNASLEQCIMIIKHFARHRDPHNPLYTRIATEHLQKISDFVSRHMLPRQPHWPVSGDNAAKHSAGGHTNAILKNPLVYQPFDPKEIGKDISLLFGPLSGGNHAKSIIEKFGYVCRDSEKTTITQYIKDYHRQRRKGITDEELLKAYFAYRQPISTTRIDYSKSAEKAEVHLYGKFFTDEPVEIHEVYEGRDSALAALKQALERRFGTFDIQSHRSQSDSAGFDASSISQIFIIDNEGLQFEGNGVDQDIEISAMKALIDAVNMAYIKRHFSRFTEIRKEMVAV